jgi:ribosomal protein L19E
MKLNIQKKLAGKITKRSKKRVRIDPERSEDV